MKLSRQAKKELFLVFAIVFVLSAFAYCSSEDYAAEQHSHDSYCAWAKSFGKDAMDTDQYREVCQ